MNDENEMKMNAAADKPPRTHVGHGPEVQSDGPSALVSSTALLYSFETV
jgi:hypothetical protein